VFLSVSSSDLLSKWQGESEKLVKNLFELARRKAPTIIFIDEIDALMSSRAEGENESTRRLKTEILIQMQGVGHQNEGVLVLAATNLPWALDPAIRRRFDKRVYIPLPDWRARAVMFQIHLGGTQHVLRKEDFYKLAKMSDGFSGSDIAVVVRDALYEPVRSCQRAKFWKKVPALPGASVPYLYLPCAESDPNAESKVLYDIPPEQLKVAEVRMEDVVKALATAKATVSKADLVQHEEWTKRFGLEGS